MPLLWKSPKVSDWQVDAAICCVHEGESLFDACPQIHNFAPWLHAATLVDMRGELGEVSVVYAPEGDKALVPRIILAGLGKADSLRLEHVRLAITRAVRQAKQLRLRSVGLVAESIQRLAVQGVDHNHRVLEEAAASAKLALYSYDALKTQEPKHPDPLLALLPLEKPESAAEKAARRGMQSAEAVILARNLVNTPANLLGPAEMEDAAIALAARHGVLSCAVLDHHALENEGMGAFLAVGQGSPRSPRLISLEYCPVGCEHMQPVVLVGKGLCFDSGGISLKPGLGMHEMKGDMGGAAAVLGALQALVALEVPQRVVGLLACAENMPDGKAVRPGDVVTTMSGKTVEILNTDAEGRLVLCDTLTFAQKYYDPRIIIDVATLTGACVVALGDHAAGLFTQDKALAQHFCELGDLVGEPYWPMPLWPSYKEPLKSESADLGNIGAREGGAIFAALFLEEFVDEGRAWIHLDIAGPSYLSKSTKLAPAGGTGFGVRALVEYVRTLGK